MNRNKNILKREQVVDNKYTVKFFIKKGEYAESYRVVNQQDEIKFLKLIDFTMLHRGQLTSNHDVLEIEILKQLNHPNILTYEDAGETVIDNKRFAYLVTEFISGETLSQKMSRDGLFNCLEAKDIVLEILKGVKYLHDKQILHNEITNTNIMLDYSDDIPVPKLIDFGLARYITQPIDQFDNQTQNPFYLPNESFNRVFSVQSDIYAIGSLFYHIVEGLPPYFFDTSRVSKEQLEIAIVNARNKVLGFSEISDQHIQSVIRVAVNNTANNRFKSAEDMRLAINKEISIEQQFETNTETIKPKPQKKGAGFADIAGMRALKEMITVDVIDALHTKERYAEYGLTIPNGVLFYGPPGCGKTFFAEKLSEEIGFNFYQINPSDIQSKWVNQSQENIKNLFEEARSNAPSIIFIDELDALMPNREGTNISHMNKSAVNEFLAQSNNSGQDNVFIIGATNRPNDIDPALLRTGRLDKHIYIPTPDFDARKEMFKIYLRKRPVELGIDYDLLAKMTENYVSSDIKFITDEAARHALRKDSRITQEILNNTIKRIKPSVSQSELNKYASLKGRMDEGKNNKRPRIGFIR